jgi:hypothetical protein
MTSNRLLVALLHINRLTVKRYFRSANVHSYFRQISELVTIHTLGGGASPPPTNTGRVPLGGGNYSVLYQTLLS